jgi:predicted nucleic acid-binding Zn ribbon protein
MPIYTYRTCRTDGRPDEDYDFIQRVADAPYTEHPDSAEPIRRVLSAPNLALRHTDRRETNILSDKNVGDKGFTRYEKVGDGKYERTAGTDGPKKFSTK